MSRRRFLKQVGALAALGASATPAGAKALQAVARNSLLDNTALATATGAAMDTAGQVSPLYGSALLVSKLLDRLRASDETRERWYYLWRKHRVDVRRRRANPSPAKVVWLQNELRRLRRLQHERNSNLNSCGKPMRDRTWPKRQKRYLEAFRLAGLEIPTWYLPSGLRRRAGI